MELLSDVWDFLGKAMNPQTIIHFGGVWLLAAVVFAETGLLVGFFLPGDSLLFLAGVLTAQGVIEQNIWIVLIIVTAAAVGGDQLGFLIGRRGGARMFRKRKESFFFRREYITITKNYFKKYGGSTLIVGRFVPIVRTFAPVLAGVVEMNHGKFISYNFFGGVLWVWSLLPAGYILGQQFHEEIERYNTYIILAFVSVTTIPVLITIISEVRKTRAYKKAQAQGLIPADDTAIDLEEIREKV